MKEIYKVWNDKLFSHFFNTSEAGKEVFCYVDEMLISELGGVDDFKKAVVSALGPTVFITEIMEAFSKNPTSVDFNNILSPKYFGVICFTIYAWTINPDLNALDFYTRFTNLLYESYILADVKQTKANRLAYGWKQSDYARFRKLLDLMFRNIHFYTSKNLSGSLGFFAYNPRPQDYVGLPRYHALLNSIEKNNIEGSLAEFNYRKNHVMSSDEIFLFIDSRKTKMFRSSTLQKWNNSEFQELIVEIITNIMKNWDETNNQLFQGEYRKNESGKLEDDTIKYRVIPFIERDLIAQTIKIFLKIEALNYDFPEKLVKLVTTRGEYSALKKGKNFSTNIYLSAKDWEIFLNGDTKFSFVIEDTIRTFIKFNSIIIFRYSVELHGFSPSENVEIGQEYYLLVNNNKSKIFLENNLNLQLLSYNPIIACWSLYKTSVNGLESLVGYDKIGQSYSEFSLNLINGYRVNSKSDISYFIDTPPQISIHKNGLCKIKFTSGSQSLDLPINKDNEIISLPKSMIAPGEMIVGLLPEGESNYENLYLNFLLLPSKMQFNALVATDDNTQTLVKQGGFIYKQEDYKIRIVSPDDINVGLNKFFQPDTGEFLYLEFLVLDNLSILLNDKEFYNTKNAEVIDNKLVLSSLCLGTHKITVFWHNFLVKTLFYDIIDKPTVSLSFNKNACLSLDSHQTEILIFNNNKAFCNLRITQKGNIPLELSINNKLVKIRQNEYTQAIELNQLINLTIMVKYRNLVIYNFRFSLTRFSPMLLDIIETTGLKWSGSNLYKPLSPPSFGLIFSEKDLRVISCITGYLGDYKYETEKTDSGYFTYVPQKNFQYIGDDLIFNLRIHGTLILQNSYLKVSTSHKPKFKIIVDGKQNGNGIYSSNNPPKFKISPIIENVTIKSDAFVIRELENEFCFSKIKLSPKDGVKTILLTSYWYKEKIEEKFIKIANFNYTRLCLDGGVTLSPDLNNVFFRNDSPTEFFVESNEGEIFNCKVSLNGIPILNQVISVLQKINFSGYKFSENDEILIEVFNGDIKSTSIIFFIAGKNYVILGNNPSEFAEINQKISWIPCWILEKRGNNKPKIYKSSFCTSSLSDCSVCKKNNDSFKFNIKKIPKIWKELFHTKIEFVEDSDRIRWENFFKLGSNSE